MSRYISLNYVNPEPDRGRYEELVNQLRDPGDPDVEAVEVYENHTPYVMNEDSLPLTDPLPFIWADSDYFFLLPDNEHGLEGPADAWCGCQVELANELVSDSSSSYSPLFEALFRSSPILITLPENLITDGRVYYDLAAFRIEAGLDEVGAYAADPRQGSVFEKVSLGHLKAAYRIMFFHCKWGSCPGTLGGPVIGPIPIPTGGPVL